MFVRSFCLVALALAVPACTDDLDKGPESADPAVGALDSIYSPTEHGELAFGAPATATLTRNQQFHAWDFTVHGPASLALATGPAVGRREVDTVIYVYRADGNGGWGRYLAKNDDAGTSQWSALDLEVDAGRYRVIVKGFSSRTTGRFAVTVDCGGSGCAPVASTCRLGETYRGFLADPAFSAVSSARLTAANQLEPLVAAQLLRAVQVTYAPTTVAEAFAAVDGGEVNRTEVHHAGSAQSFVAYEFGAGDNSYGAIFSSRTLDLAAEIRDGDLTACTFVAAPGGVQQGEACLAIDACADGLTCQGFTGGRGVCVSTAAIPGDGASCSSVAPDCGDARLVCAGLTRGDQGMCLPAGQRRSFSDVAAAAIPDGGTLTRQLTGYGLATVDMDVELRALLHHDRPSQLRVYLANPVGTEVLVYDGPTASDDRDVYVAIDGGVRGFSGDESVNGTWTLRTVDLATGATGTLTSWHLTITSRWD